MRTLCAETTVNACANSPACCLANPAATNFMPLWRQDKSYRTADFRRKCDRGKNGFTRQPGKLFDDLLKSFPPAATFSSTSSTGMRVPFMTGLPVMILKSDSIYLRQSTLPRNLPLSAILHPNCITYWNPLKFIFAYSYAIPIRPWKNGYIHASTSKLSAKGLAKRTPSRICPSWKSSLKMTGIWLRRAAAHIWAS